MVTARLLLSVALLSGADESQEPKPTDEAVQRERDKQSAERVLALAKKYEFFVEMPERRELELHAKPVLTYSNPIRGEVYGNVFVWTLDGRPELLGAVFDFRNEDKFDSELHMLSRSGICGSREGREFWRPERPTVEFSNVPDGPVPAANPAARLRQMREIARAITVERNHPEQGKGEMRLLTQPLYRYQSTQVGVIDGGLFVFAEGTDPEAFLLLEATNGGRAEPTWKFAFARMNIVEFRAQYHGAEIWHVASVSWDNVFDKQEAYAIIREKPSRGLVRSK